jgi:hypothetical protein
MPYFYDWINKRWQPYPKGSDPMCPKYTTRSFARRFTLLPQLIKEIETGEGEVKLYAGLLARAIVVSDIDPTLMNEFGERIAELTEPEQKLEKS